MVTSNEGRPGRSLVARGVVCSLGACLLSGCLIRRDGKRVKSKARLVNAFASACAGEKAEQAEDTQRIQEGMYAMQTDTIERLDDLSQESRKQLKGQIERVQKEARKLRAQARRLRRAQSAETRQRKKLLEQVAESSKGWGQSVLQRGNNLAASGASLAGSQLRSGQQKALESSKDFMQRGNELAASGASLAGSQLRSGQQKALEYGGNLMQGASQIGSQTTQKLGQNASGWSDEAAYRLRRQGKHLAQNTSDWGDDTVYRLRRQGQQLFQNLADWGDEVAYQLHKQGRKLNHNLIDRKEDAIHQLHIQKRDLGRNLADRREGATRQLRRQGRSLGRNLAGRRDDAMRKMRKQRDYLSERGGHLLEPVRENKLWSVFGFFSGLLLAAGITYWLVRRGLDHKASQEVEGIELEVSEPLNGAVRTPGGERRATSKGGTVVATRLATSAGPKTRFVGVLSSRRYYPLGRNPDAPDLVFFESEDDARAEGFTAAE